MGAAVISDALVDDTRVTMRTLTVGKSPRIHWRDEQASRKHLIAKTVASTKVDSLVVVGTMIDPRKQERARAQVLKELLLLLDGRDVAHTVIESRRDDDRRDLALVGHMRNAGHLSRRLIVVHGQPVQEPMLWIPDAVLGAVGDRQCGTGAFYEHLEHRVTVVALDQTV